MSGQIAPITSGMPIHNSTPEKDPGLRSTCDAAHAAKIFSCVALFQDSSVIFQAYLAIILGITQGK